MKMVQLKAILIITVLLCALAVEAAEPEGKSYGTFNNDVTQNLTRILT